MPTARAPGHGELPNKIFLDLVEANRPQFLEAVCIVEKHLDLPALHELQQ
jgi:hypothetical protein